MKKYQHIFFDLDHTLWDFDRNAEVCLFAIYEQQHLERKGVPSFTDFLEKFTKINRSFWAKLEAKEITHEELRQQRFGKVLEALGCGYDASLSEQINDQFLDMLPSQSHLIEGATEILHYLKPNYQLHILSNGFYEIQFQKMKSATIHTFFDAIVTVETANARKPDKEIFHSAIQKVNARLEQCIMIGDTFEADIIGAANAGMDSVHFLPYAIPPLGSPATFTIQKLEELKQIL